MRIELGLSEIHGERVCGHIDKGITLACGRDMDWCWPQVLCPVS